MCTHKYGHACTNAGHSTTLPALGRASGILSRLSAPPINLGVSGNKLCSVPERSVAAKCLPEAAETPANLTKKGSFYYN